MVKKNLKLTGSYNTLIDSGNILGGFAGMREESARPTLLLHSCCGPCSTSVIERLASDYCITVYYYNPCITDSDEYEKRKSEQIRFINIFNQKYNGICGISFIEGDYEPDKFIEATYGHEGDPEGGDRCTICFGMRLNKTADFAKAKGFEIFATTLTVSPHKNYPLISKLGNEIADRTGVRFLDMDFKKKAGFQRSIQLSKEYELYRQNYCGCLYSIRNNLD